MSNPSDSRHLAAWLRLELEPGIGPVHARLLINMFGHPADLYDTPYAQLQQLGSKKLASQLLQPLTKSRETAISRALRWSEQPGNHI